VSLVEKAQQVQSAEEAAALQDKMAKGQITLDDLIVQMEKMTERSTIKDLMKMIPGVGAMMGDADMGMEEGDIAKMKAVVQSMTPRERKDPTIIDGSRRRRIARGSGSDTEDVSQLCKMFVQTRDVMRLSASMSLRDRMKFVSQFSQHAMAGGKIGKLKGSTVKKDFRSSRDKRRDRKRRSR